MPMPNISQLDLSDMELLPTSDEDSKEYENPDLFEGDIVISPEEIEHYYGKQTNTQVRVPSSTLLFRDLLHKMDQIVNF